MEEAFGNAKAEAGRFVSYFGAMDPITVSLQGKNSLAVEIVTKKDVDDETALKTIRAKNAFLEAATGYSAKERFKKLKEKAKQGEG